MLEDLLVQKRNILANKQEEQRVMLHHLEQLQSRRQPMPVFATFSPREGRQIVAATEDEEFTRRKVELNEQIAQLEQRLKEMEMKQRLAEEEQKPTQAQEVNRPVKKPETRLLFPAAKQTDSAVKKEALRLTSPSFGDIPAGMPSSLSARKREAMFNVDALQHLRDVNQIANSARSQYQARSPSDDRLMTSFTLRESSSLPEKSYPKTEGRSDKLKLKQLQAEIKSL